MTRSGEPRERRDIVASFSGVSHRYRGAVALDDVMLDIPSGVMAGIIGPDGVGKSTLLALAAGVRKIQSGDVAALGGDMRSSAHRRTCYARIAYMPQGLGRNLYPTLSVFENLDFFGRLFGQDAAERRERIDDLLRSTGLDPFPDRPAGKLSGGMKQKLSLCCALIHDPDLLVLDEPTTGVDPLSRRQFWELIERIRRRQPQMSVIAATAYMEEAKRFDWLAAMDAGRIVSTGSPEDVRSRTGEKSLEDAFVSLLPEEKRRGHRTVRIPPRETLDGPPAIEAEGLTKRFDKFTAVDHVSFRIEKGEIFGFLGSNGCGKSTTMKMLTGLLPASEGRAWLLGQPINSGDVSIRRRVGYMSQSFSLYRELTVRQNLDLHAGIFELPRESRQARIAELLEKFELTGLANSYPEGLPLGMRQRLQLAVAVLHRPEMLILDEPTSGVDPIARDRFWQYLVDLSRNESITIFLSTHFMNEAERCDRISLMHAGRVLAAGKPQALTAARGAATLEEAFIGYLQDAAGSGRNTIPEVNGSRDGIVVPATARPAADRPVDLRRLWAYARRESVEVLRDPIRLAFALLGPVLLMVAFGFGITFDVERLPYAAFDQDQSYESRELLANFEGSRYFRRMPEIAGAEQIDNRLRSGEIKLAVEVPAGFGKDLKAGRKPEVGIWLDGAIPFRAETTRGYVGGVAMGYLVERAKLHTSNANALLPADIGIRFRYNQEFRSAFATVPGVIMLMLIMIPAMMTAVGVVREKETGSIANFRSTPVTGLEFLVGKQAPYVAIAFLSFLILVAEAYVLFGVPVKGSFAALASGAFFYVLAATGFGLLISSFTRTQIAAIFATPILAMVPALNFSGMLTPVSSLDGVGRAIGLGFPSAWFQQISVGTFAKGLGFAELWQNHLALLVFAIAFIGAARFALPKQED
ncbi:MAG: ribosome-associated ATPase/putative transporter RbbA [Rhizobiales bacterium]|nr:ribosome-associated ATPase/putative transporter RbbA [Hyphomicrobiales bacterium]